MWHDNTGLPWIMPSPNMPTLDTAAVYPGMCLIEGTNLSEGRGTTRPFEIIGAPWIDAPVLRDALDEMELPGAAFREAYFTPTASKFSGDQCAGVQVHVTDRTRFRPVASAVAVVSVLLRLYPRRFEFRQSGDRFFFDILCGTDAIRKSLLDGVSPADIADSWEHDIRRFSKDAGPILLY
jgi:uncharacterized protein YbbC (DUF1343 family)